MRFTGFPKLSVMSPNNIAILGSSTLYKYI